MMNYKLMNVLLSDAPHFVQAPALLLRSTKPFGRAQDDESAWTLSGPAIHDFTTYFNALSLSKWQEYTNVRDFFLHLEIRGATCRVQGTRADSFSRYSEDIESCFLDVPASDEWREVSLKLPGSSDDVIESFKVVCEGSVDIRNAYYYTEVDESSLRPVDLALCTTTFKKEEFITANISLIRQEILESDEPVSQHFTMHVVDNGRTLDAESLSSEHIFIHGNDNVGGAGGFARGMIEAMEQSPCATHVLLMDDDVRISPESIIRTYNLLSLVKDEYEEAFVSGAMMNMDEPDVRWEDMGFIGFDGDFHPIKPSASMNSVHEFVDGEAFDIPSYMPNCGDQGQCYAAWWFCVIPMKQIERNGLPLPIFVRGDDVEYSRRCKPRFMTMNGICIWHLSFHLRYSAAQERYQMTRNCFIDQFTSEFASLSDFESALERHLRIELRKFNYDDAALILDAFEDFMKGPKWLVSNEARTAFLDAGKRAASLLPWDELVKRAGELGVDLEGVTDWQIWRDLPYSTVDAAINHLSANGQRLTGVFTKKGKVAVIDNVGWALPVGKIHLVETIVSVDIPNRRGAIRSIDPVRYRELHKRYKKLLRLYRKRKEALKAEYANAKAEMTSVQFWKNYLGLAS